MNSIEVDNQDLHSFLGSLSRRLQLYGESLMGLVHLGEGTESIDELGNLLCQDATRLKAGRDLLCERCRLHEMVDILETRKVKGGKSR